MRQLVVIKIGSQALLGDDGTFDQSVIRNIASDIRDYRDRGYDFIIVSSGACALGRSVLRGVDSTILDNQVTASIGQPLLMKTYQEIFSAFGILVSQALLTRYDFSNKETYGSIYRVLQKELELGILPIINENDVVANEELVFSDNDQLASFVAMMMSASKLLLLSNIEGLYTSHPDDGGKLVSVVDQIDDTIFGYISHKKSSAGRGGMYSKLISAQTATNSGIEVIIGPGRRSHILREVLSDGDIGTVFKKQEISRKKSRTENWIQSGAIVRGKVIVNSCLAKLLTEKKRISLLEIGILGTQGNFLEGDTIEVIDSEGNVYGKGISKISSEELKGYQMGEKSRIVIHANYFVYS